MKFRFRKKPKYLMTIIDGEFGDGKTIFLVSVGIETWKSYEYVYANFELYEVENFEFLDKINRNVLLNLKPNSLLLIQEAYHYLDRRFCMKKENIKTSQALMQIRKGKYDMFCDVFECDFLDFRAVKFSNMFIRAKGEIGNGIFAYVPLRYNKKTMEFSESNNVMVKNMAKYYDRYNTFEITEKQPLISSFTK